MAPIVPTLNASEWDHWLVVAPVHNQEHSTGARHCLAA